MGDQNKFHTDKEKDAVNLNLKEDRVLEKAIQTLDLEKSYAMKLIDLERKQVKVSQKRMRNRVKTIRTHLNPEAIIKMQTLELQGKFKSEYTPMNASGIIRILAATKRLKLMTNDEVRELVEKDLKRPLRAESTTVTSLSRPVTPATSLRKRSSSVPKDLQCRVESANRSNRGTKSFPPIKQDLCDDLVNLRSASHLIRRASSQESVNRNCDTGVSRPHGSLSSSSTHLDMDTDDVDGEYVSTSHQSRAQSAMTRSTSKQAHVMTTRGFLAARPNTSHVANTSRLPPRTPRTSRPKTSLGVPNRNYSSHTLRTNTEDKCRRESILSTSSIGSDIARDKAAEFRKRLLDSEEMHTSSIDSRRQSFLTRIGHWVDKNPPIHTPTFTPRSRSRSPEKLQYDIVESTNVPVNEWAKLKQCRWLRLGDQEGDTTGVTTLVRDQIRQLIGLRL